MELPFFSHLLLVFKSPLKWCSLTYVPLDANSPPVEDPGLGKCFSYMSKSQEQIIETTQISIGITGESMRIHQSNRLAGGEDRAHGWWQAVPKGQVGWVRSWVL